MGSLSRALVAAIVVVAVFVGLVGLPAVATAATKPNRFSSAPVACSYAGTALASVVAPAPRAAMEPFWRRPHGGRVAGAQYVELLARLQGSTGSGWRTLASQHRFVLVHAKLRSLPALTFAQPRGATSYRVIETLRWIKPTSRTRSDKSASRALRGTCAASDGAAAAPTGPPAPLAPPACPTWSGDGDYAAPGWAGGSYTLTMKSTSSDRGQSAGDETRVLSVPTSGLQGSFAVNTNAWSTGEPVTISIDPVTITYGASSESCPSYTFGEVGTD